MVYDTVYDISQGWIEGWPFLAGGALLTVTGAVLVSAPQLAERLLPGGTKGRLRRVFSWIFFGFSLLWTVIVATSMIPAHLSLQAAVRDGTCRVAEGVVQDFEPGDANRKPERFRVAGVPFSYSDSQINGGFNQTNGSGGPVRAGLRVRICYMPIADGASSGDGSGNVILRLGAASGG